MRKKLRGALALILSAVMMLAPLTGASAAEGFAISYRAVIAMPNEWWIQNYDGQHRARSYEPVYSGDILSEDAELIHAPYAGDKIVRYWEGDGYESGTVKEEKFSESNESEIIDGGMWRAVNATSLGHHEGSMDLEAVGAVVSGYPQMLGTQKLYMFKGVNSQTYYQVEKTEGYSNESRSPIVLSASKIRALFKEKLPSFEMNFYEAALYEEVGFDKVTETVGEVRRYTTILREKTPEAAVELIFPYPKGYDVQSDPDAIKVLHVTADEDLRLIKEEVTQFGETITTKEQTYTLGEEAFTLEEDGIHVKTQRLSPFAVAYLPVEDPSAGNPPDENPPVENLPVEDLPRTGDSSMLMLWIGLMTVSVTALFAARRRRA